MSKIWMAAARPPVVDYLKAQVLIAEKRYAEALAALERVTEARLTGRACSSQTADLYLRLGRWRDAQQVYEKALAIDPDNADAHLGLCRMALRRRKFRVRPRIRLWMRCRGFITIRWPTSCSAARWWE